MRLPFFRPKDQAPEPQSPEPPRRKGRAGRNAGAELPLDDAAIAAARTQARRRLVGAVVLLAVGVIGFPLLFETQPRPLPQDTPVVVAADALANRPVAAVRPVLPEVPADAGVEPVASAPQATPGVALPASAPTRPAPPATDRAPAPTPQPKPAPPAPAPAPPAARAATAPPATASAPAAARWVVQVGAYNDPERLKAARAKLQLLGYASYTQEVDSPTGRRTRVRVGPFKTRAEADAVAKRVKTGGLQAAVLSL
jgi:DedD protein